MPAPRSDLWRFFRYSKPYRGLLVLATLVGIVKFNLPIAFPWILKEIVDRVLAGQPSTLGLGLEGLLALGFGVALVHCAITYLRTFLADRLAQLIALDVRRDLFAHLLRLPLEFFAQHQTGAVASRLITDVTLAHHLVSLLGTNVFMEFSVLIAVTFVVFAMHAELALAAYATLPLYLLAHKWIGVRLRAGAREARARMDLLEGDLHETITAIADVKSFTSEPEQSQRFLQRCVDHLAVAQRNVRVFGASLAATALLTRIPSLVVLGLGAHQVQQGELSIGGLMAFLAYLEMVYNPITRLGDLNVQLANSRAAIERIFELLDTPAEPQPAAGAAGAAPAPPLVVHRGEIAFDEVAFAYASGGPPALRGVTATIAPGSRVALVGPSGAGKSTLIKLLVRFYTPTAGSIAIDGQDIGAVDLRSLRAQIAVVPQDPILITGTIADNLRLGKPDASASELWHAVERAHAAEFLRHLPDGLETRVGERGVTLSGGQRQRLAIARAFLKDAKILVLDEATAHLDPISERLVHEASMRLATGRTTIVIAHRLSTVRTADRLLVLEHGRIVQDGTHDELLRDHQGAYDRLYRGELVGQ